MTSLLSSHSSTVQGFKHLRCIWLLLRLMAPALRTVATCKEGTECIMSQRKTIMTRSNKHANLDLVLPATAQLLYKAL